MLLPSHPLSYPFFIIVHSLDPHFLIAFASGPCSLACSNNNAHSFRHACALLDFFKTKASLISCLFCGPLLHKQADKHVRDLLDIVRIDDLIYTAGAPPCNGRQRGRGRSLVQITFQTTSCRYSARCNFCLWSVQSALCKNRNKGRLYRSSHHLFQVVLDLHDVSLHLYELHM